MKQMSDQFTLESDPVPHLCHAMGCRTEVAPRFLMCARHWRLVPKHMQLKVWKHYRKGQEIDKQPSAEYLDAAKEAIDSVAISKPEARSKFSEMRRKLEETA